MGPPGPPGKTGPTGKTGLTGKTGPKGTRPLFYIPKMMLFLRISPPLSTAYTSLYVFSHFGMDRETLISNEIVALAWG